MEGGRERFYRVMTAAGFLQLAVWCGGSGSRAVAVLCALGAAWPMLAGRRSGPRPSALLEEVPIRKGFVYVGAGREWRVSDSRELREAVAAGRAPAEGRGIDLFMPLSLLGQHALLLGTTGSGKTRLLELLLVQAIRRGDGVAVIDPKGDERLLARVYEEAAGAGRGIDLVALPYPKASVPYNPVGRFMETREVADRIAAILPAGGDAEPFRNFAWEIAHTTAAAMRQVGEPVTLASLRRYALETPWELVRRALGGRGGRDLRRAAEAAAAQAGPELRALVGLVTRPAEHTQKMASALLPLLSKLTAGTNRELLSPASGGFAWEDLETRGRVAYFYLGSLLGADTASAVARMALLDFQSYVGRRYASGGIDRPVSLFVDELADVVSPPFVQVLNKCRGAGVRVTMAAQTLADLEATLGSEARARQVAANVNTVVQFRAQSADDALAFSGLTGERLLPVPSEGEAYEPALFSAGLRSVDDFRALFSRHRAWKEQPLVPPWAVMDLAPLECFARWDARVFKGRVPLLAAPAMGPVRSLQGHGGGEPCVRSL